mmetsp:Transcript_41105/g.87552  ORF Transcript_41105/g.87552 Transcript_41105/m.87552 type:complete len:377 (-) Transcript_41105:115-1245(-)
MAPMKRPAAAQAGPAKSKKPATASSKDIKVVADALLLAELPEAVISLLTENLMVSLGVAKEERHQYQEEVIAMISETLDGVEAAIKDRIATSEGKVAEAETDKASREKAAEEATTTATAKSEAVDAAKAALAESTAAHKAAKIALSTAESEQKVGDAKLDAAAGKKTKLESALNGTYTPIKMGTATPDEVKEGLAMLVKLGKEYSLDPSMLTSLPAALNKAPDSRGSFDAMVLTQVEEEISKHIQELDEELAKGEPSKAERAAKVTTATAELEAAATAETTAKATLKEAQTAQKEAEAEQKAAAKKVKDFDPEMRQVAADLDEEKANLEKLQTGAVATFKALSERSNIPPPEEEKAEEVAPAEEAPAETVPELPVA